MKSREKRLAPVTKSPLHPWTPWVQGFLILSMTAWGLYQPLLLQTHSKNGRFLASTYEMQEETFDLPELRRLRQREHLDDVVKAGANQFEKIILLRHWAHSQWISGGHFYYPPWNALEILDLAREHQNHGFCAQYAIVFLQACQSLGIHARYVELEGHFLTAVWSDEFDRWVIMDPTTDVYFERDGKPMRGRDLCDAYWANKVQGIEKVEFGVARVPVSRADLKIYSKYAIVKNADQLTHPVVMRVNGSATEPLVHESDYHRYPLIGRDQLALGSPYLAWKAEHATEFFTDKPQSDDPDDFGYVLNQAMIYISRRRPNRENVKIRLLSENAPSFDEFLYEVDDLGWQSTPLHSLTWPLHPGTNALRVRVHTKFGWEGPPSSLTLFYKPKGYRSLASLF